MSTPLVINNIEFERVVIHDVSGLPVLYPNVYKVVNGVTITSEQTIWTPAAGKKFRLMGMWFGITTLAGPVLFKDNTGGTNIAIIPLGTTSSVPFEFGDRGILSAAANNVLSVIGPTGAVLSGMVWGREE